MDQSALAANVPATAIGEVLCSTTLCRTKFEFDSFDDARRFSEYSINNTSMPAVFLDAEGGGARFVVYTSR